MKANSVLLACLAAAPVFAQVVESPYFSPPAYTNSPANVEAIVGGTFLNFRDTTTGETRNGFTISPLTLGANVQDATKTTVTMVNWSVNDTSDASRMMGALCVEDNNRRNSTSPFAATDYNPFSVTVSGLTPNANYLVKVVAMGVRPDLVSDPTGMVLRTAKPDYGIGTYDFSYGASAGAMTTFANAATGTLLYEEKSSATKVPAVTGPDYFYYKGAYACDIGQLTASASGDLTLYLGQGEVNTYLNGARTMLDGLVITPVPEPQMLVPVALGLAGVALIRRRKQSV